MATNEAPRVYLVPYDPVWPELAARLIEDLLAVCGPAGTGAITGVEHIGSTSIPGCAGKPLIDLMPALVRYEAGLDCVEPLEALGYDYRGEYGLPRRHYFTRFSADSSVGLTEHLHMYTPGEGQWDDQLAFRDYLRAHDEARDEYVALKHVLAKRHPYDGEAYADDKSEFVQRVLRLAREEASA